MAGESIHYFTVCKEKGNNSFLKSKKIATFAPRKQNHFLVGDEKEILIVADNQPITRVGVILFRDKTIPGGEVFTAGNKAGLIRLPARCPEAAVVTDYSLFDLPGPDSLFIICKRFPHTRWIFFGNCPNEGFLFGIGNVLKASRYAASAGVVDTGNYYI
ncbi:MAG: hypothetical protein LBP64_00570 [Tannerella sp.]|nr:hypothetical protein [Tannerella sp.]